MGYPLFRQKKIIGHLSVAAKLHAEWKSTVLAPPSPKYTIETAASLPSPFYPRPA